MEVAHDNEQRCLAHFREPDRQRLGIDGWAVEAEAKRAEDAGGDRAIAGRNTLHPVIGPKATESAGRAVVMTETLPLVGQHPRR
jgi:hypothetical protein